MYKWNDEVICESKFAEMRLQTFYPLDMSDCIDSSLKNEKLYWTMERELKRKAEQKKMEKHDIEIAKKCTFELKTVGGSHVVW